jgi:hypothetical protein
MYVLVALRFSQAVMFVMDEDLVICDIKSGFHTKSLHVGFAKEKVALGQVFLPLPRFSFVKIIAPMFHTHRHDTRYSNQDKRAKLGKLKQALLFRLSWSTRLQILNFFCIIHL